MSMKPDTVQLLAHMVEATTSIIQRTENKTLEDYIRDSYLRSAVERQFIIIGEAMNLLREVEPSAGNRVSDYQSIISFRSVLVHEFFQVDDSRVWNTVREHLSTLHREVAELIREYERR